MGGYRAGGSRASEEEVAINTMGALHKTPATDAVLPGDERSKGATRCQDFAPDVLLVTAGLLRGLSHVIGPAPLARGYVCRNQGLIIHAAS